MAITSRHAPTPYPGPTPSAPGLASPPLPPSPDSAPHAPLAGAPPPPGGRGRNAATSARASRRASAAGSSGAAPPAGDGAPARASKRAASAARSDGAFSAWPTLSCARGAGSGEGARGAGKAGAVRHMRARPTRPPRPLRALHCRKWSLSGQPDGTLPPGFPRWAAHRLAWFVGRAAGADLVRERGAASRGRGRAAALAGKHAVEPAARGVVDEHRGARADAGQVAGRVGAHRQPQQRVALRLAAAAHGPRAVSPACPLTLPHPIPALRLYRGRASRLQPIKCALRGVVLTSPSLAQLASLAHYAGAAAAPMRQGVGESAALPTWGAAALAVKPRCAAPEAGRPRAFAHCCGP